jgi:hypothetical protein
LRYDAADNTNTIIITNTTNIIDLKKWVDIDGNGSDADLTGWDVSHITDASRAFFDATTFNQNIGVDTLLTFQFPIFWLKSSALENI